MLHSVLLNYRLRVAARVESASKNFRELLVKTANSQLLEAHVFFEKLLCLIRADFNICLGLLADFEAKNCVLVDDAKVLSARMGQSIYDVNLDFDDHGA